MPAMETIERLVGEFVCLVKVKSVLNTDSDEIGCYHVMGRLRLNKTSYTANKGHRFLWRTAVVDAISHTFV